MGLFLGYAILHVPDLLRNAYQWITKQNGGKNKPRRKKNKIKQTLDEENMSKIYFDRIFSPWSISNVEYHATSWQEGHVPRYLELCLFFVNLLLITISINNSRTIINFEHYLKKSASCTEYNFIIVGSKLDRLRILLQISKLIVPSVNEFFEYIIISIDTTTTPSIQLPNTVALVAALLIQSNSKVRSIPIDMLAMLKNWK